MSQHTRPQRSVAPWRPWAVSTGDVRALRAQGAAQARVTPRRLWGAPGPAGCGSHRGDRCGDCAARRLVRLWGPRLGSLGSSRRRWARWARGLGAPAGGRRAGRGHIPGAGGSRDTSTGTAPGSGGTRRPRQLRSPRAGHLLVSPNVPISAGKSPRLVSCPSRQPQTSVTARVGSGPFPAVRFSSPFSPSDTASAGDPACRLTADRAGRGSRGLSVSLRDGPGDVGTRTPVFRPRPTYSRGYLWIRQLTARAQTMVPKTTSM